MNFFKNVFSPLSLFVIFCGISAHAQGGGDRGGGDPYKGAVLGIGYEILEKLTSDWVDKEIAPPTADQIKEINAIIPDAYLTALQASKLDKNILKLDSTQIQKIRDTLPILEVVSADHVYEDEAKALSLNPVERFDAKERFLVWRQDKLLPEIDVGRKLWDTLDNKPIEKEYLVLHDLCGASKLVKHGNLDNQFFITYVVKLFDEAKWLEFKGKLKAELDQIYALTQRGADFDFSHYLTFANTLKQSNAYFRLINPEGFLRNKHFLFKTRDKAVKQVQQTAFDELNTMLDRADNSFIRDAVTSPNRQIEKLINTIIKKSEKDFNAYNTEWQTWANGMIHGYTDSYFIDVADFATRKTSYGAMTNYVRKVACTVPANDDLPVHMTCEFNAMITDFPASLEPAIQKLQTKFDTRFSDLLKKIDTTIEPVGRP